MKCDELKAYKGDVTIPVYGTIADAEVYLKDKADEAIAELKQKLENVQASMYADIVDANMKNVKLKEKLDSMAQQFSKYVVDAHNRERKLKRAFYKSCDNWAVCEMDYWRKCLEHYEDYFNVRTDEDLTEEKCERMIDNWRKVAHNCRAKAEEFK